MSRKDYFVMLALMVLASFLGGMCAVLLIGYPANAKEQSPNKVVTTEELRILDKNGKARVVISGSLVGDAGSGPGASPEAVEGTSGIVLQDTDGTPNVLLRAFPNGYAEIRFMHSRAQSGPYKGEVTLAALLDRHELTFHSNQNDLPTASLGLTTDVEGMMRALLGKELADKLKEVQEKQFGKHNFVESPFVNLIGGEPYIYAVGNKPSLGLSKAEARVSLSLDDHDEPSIELSDKDGKVRAILGSAYLEATRTGTQETTAASSLVLFDKKGKVTWRTP